MKTVKIPTGRPDDPEDREKAFRFLARIFEESVLAHEALPIPAPIAQDVRDAIVNLEDVPGLLPPNRRFMPSPYDPPRMSLERIEDILGSACAVAIIELLRLYHQVQTRQFAWRGSAELVEAIFRDEERINRLGHVISALHHLEILCGWLRKPGSLSVLPSVRPSRVA